MKNVNQKVNVSSNIARNVIRFGIPSVVAMITFTLCLNFFNVHQHEDLLQEANEITEATTSLLQPYEHTLTSMKSYIFSNPLASQDNVDIFLDNLQIEKNLPSVDFVFYWKRVSVEQFSEFHQKLSTQDYLTNKKHIPFDLFTYFTPFNSSDIHVTKYLYSNRKSKATFPSVGSMAPGVLNNQLSNATTFARIVSGYELIPEDFQEENNQYIVLSYPYFNNQGMYAGAIALSIKMDNLFFSNIQNKIVDSSVQIINPRTKQIIFTQGEWPENIQEDNLFEKEISIMEQPLIIKVINNDLNNSNDKKVAAFFALLTFILTYLIIYSFLIKRKEEDQNSQDMISHFNNLSNQANTDQLTNLFNRRCFFSDISEKIEKLENLEESSTEKKLFLLFVDLDGFKIINDHLGHAAGDEILRQYSVRLKTNPLASNSTIYRMGGDEFVLAFDSNEKSGTISVRTIMRIAHELLKITDIPFNIKGEDRMLSQSIGIAQYTDGTPEDFLTNADTAMYEAKRLGKNRVVYYSSELHNKVKNRIEILKCLKMAIEQNEFYLVFQPKVTKCDNKKNHQCSGAEVLMRWESKNLGNISPQIFIPIAEEAGMMALIDNWLILEAATKIKQFRDLGMSQLFSINISAKQFSNINLPEYFYKTLQDNGISPSDIIIEITESATIREPELAKAILKKFRKYGFGVSVDDFGTGYSSISYLRQFPVTELKFDKSFTRNINVDEHDEIIISGLYNIAQQLHMDIVMEGVETAKQISWIEKNIPKAIIQGYFFSKPLSFDAFIAFCKNNTCECISGETNVIEQNSLPPKLMNSSEQEFHEIE